MKTYKDLYRKFCKGNTTIPIFLQPFWLDTVADAWDVLLEVEGTHNETIVAVLPYCIKGNIITKRIYLPDVSFYQSIYFIKKITVQQQQQIAVSLFAKIPFTLKSYFKFIPECTKINLTTLGYKKEIYTTYALQNSKSYVLNKHHQRQVQKGVKQQYHIKESKNLNASYELIEDTFLRKNIKPKLSLSMYQQINTVVQKYHCGQILDCVDKDKNLLATILFVEDNACIYYLFSGYNINFKNSGAITFLLHHIIQQAIEKGKTFNFCGSSNKNIANYFVGFGAQPMEIPIWKKGIL
ncbi:MAG TPA: peptidoglycan bridge formation glycyltransferase FemA/FemB family protein [Chitinophagales bacterium]|nr:peptidoglycan bridge formation glycyltransferase FemA/FemB family protein [Chitinophagales bacterium]